MKIKYKFFIAFLLMIATIFIIIHIKTQTGKATTATVEFSIVSNVTTPSPVAPSPGAGGGGGGGGGGQFCSENWTCLPWDKCSEAEYQTRGCRDINKCKTIFSKPTEVQRCNYLGRPANCFDNIKNSNEEGVDCGGGCVQCPNCNDGIKNGNENDVDCGGACQVCVKYAEIDTQKPAAFFRLSDITSNMTIFWPIWLVLTIMFLLLIYLYRYMHEGYVEQKLHKHAYR